MNRKLLRKIRRGLLNHKPIVPDVGFNMGYFAESTDNTAGEDVLGTSCGTVGCIAGWALMYSGIDPDSLPCTPKIGKGAEILNLDRKIAHDLFLARPDDKENFDTDPSVDIETITPEQAAQAITNLLKTGTPQWETILEYEKV